MPQTDTEAGSSRAAPDKGQLWQRARDGDREAADELARASYRQVYAWLFKLTRDPDLAADLTQETYQRAWRSLPTFRGSCRITSWLCRIAYTTFLNHVRRPRAMVSLSDDAATVLPDTGASPEEATASSLEAERLRRAVLALPEAYAFAVTARFWAELPVREVAALQEVSTVTIRKRLKKALARLAATLEEEV